MVKDNNFETKQQSMIVLTSFVNSIVEPLIPKYMKEYLNDIKIYWIKIKPKLEITDRLNNEEITAPTLTDSYLESRAVKNSSKNVYENIEISNDFPANLILLKDFYFFVIFAVCSHDKGRLSKGYCSDLSDDYFAKEDFYKLLNTNALTAMYVNHYLVSNAFPEDALFTALSAEQYEKSDSRAQIVFSDCPEPCDLVCEFDEKYKLSEENLRMLRKLMEITKKTDAKLDTKKSDLALVAVKDGNNIWSIVGTTEVTKENPTIKFEGKLNWSLIEDEKVMFQFYKGRYILNWGEERKEYETQIKNVRSRYQRIVGELVDILKEQEHGTAAIISDKAPLDTEITRLCTMNKGIRIKEFDFLDSGTNKDYMNQMGMTNIDGAAFIDTEGKCHAIGVIVDGKTVIEGNAGRGARFNSIRNYVNWVYDEKHEYFVGIIISEDGMINIVVPERT